MAYSPVLMSDPGHGDGAVASQNQQTGGGGASRGQFVFNGALYCLLQLQGNHITPSLLYMVKSSDNGATWADLDFANSPQTSAQPAPNPPSNGSCLFDDVLQLLTVAYNAADVSGGINVAIKLRDFDLVTETWGADYATVGAPTCFGCNQLFRRSDGSVVFLHNTNPPSPNVTGLTASVFAAGVWSSFAVDTNIGATTSNSGSSAVMDPATDIIHVFLTTKGAGNINFVTYQQILPDNSLGPFFNFTNEFANLGTTGAIVEAMGNPIIVGDQILWGQVPTDGTVPSIMVGTPLSAPVWSVLGSPGIDAGFPGASSSTIQPTLAFDGTTIYAVYVFLENDFTTHSIRLAQTTNLLNPLAGPWTAAEIYDDSTGPITWDLGVQFPTIIADASFSTTPLISTQGVISAISSSHLSFFMGGVTPPHPPVTVTFAVPSSGGATGGPCFSPCGCDPPYPLASKVRWNRSRAPVMPPHNSRHEFASGAVAAPVAGVSTVIASFQVPNGYRFRPEGLVLAYNGANWIPGDGNIIFAVTVNQPGAAQGIPYTNFGKVLVPLGSVTLGPYPVEPGDMSDLSGRDVMRISVITTGVIPSGAPNFFLGTISGRMWPEGLRK